MVLSVLNDLQQQFTFSLVLAALLDQTFIHIDQAVVQTNQPLLLLRLQQVALHFRHSMTTRFSS